jgi:hypothetical protein
MEGSYLHASILICTCGPMAYEGAKPDRKRTSEAPTPLYKGRSALLTHGRELAQ